MGLLQGGVIAGMGLVVPVRGRVIAGVGLGVSVWGGSQLYFVSLSITSVG